MYDFMGAVAANPDLLTDVADHSADGVAVDLGAYVGDWSERMAERYGCTVYAFEPSPGPAAKATDALRVHPRSPSCLTASERRTARQSSPATVPARRSTAARGSSDRSTSRSETSSRCSRSSTSPTVDVLKINIEGAEYDLLDRLAEAGWLPADRHVVDPVPRVASERPSPPPADPRALLPLARAGVAYGWVWELWRPRREAGLRARH